MKLMSTKLTFETEYNRDNLAIVLSSHHTLTLKEIQALFQKVKKPNDRFISNPPQTETRQRTIERPSRIGDFVSS